MEALEQRLWLDCRNGVAAAREQLVSQYLPLAKRLAGNLYAQRRVDDIEFGDYQQLAYVGLLEAVDRYRADGGAQFATFATYRIRGSILNGIARMTETGERIDYLRRARRDRAESMLDAQPKSDDELGSLLDLVVAVAITCQLDEIAEHAAAEPTPSSDPYSSRLYEDTQRRLRKSLQDLPERERQIVQLHYFEQVGFDELTGLLGVTKGRVSQLHRRALDRIREAMGRTRLAEFY
jgi:RNA polymerase sigma factor FliA